MAMRLRPKADPIIYVSRGLQPAYLAVLGTYMRFVGVEIIEADIDPRQGTTSWQVSKEQQERAIAVILQTPNFFGVAESLDGVANQAFKIGVCTEALAMAYLAPLPVDIMVGDSQSFGIPIQLGGPTAGFFATKKKWVRKMPGRIVGRTLDAKGEEAFCITLATREQFIRREKATSNICTASGLMCLRSTIYLSLMGRKGLQDLATKNAQVARYFAKGLRQIGLEPIFEGSFFNEFVVDAAQQPELYEKLLAQDLVLGLPLEKYFPERKNQYLLNFTEKHFAAAEAILTEIKSHA